MCHVDDFYDDHGAHHIHRRTVHIDLELHHRSVDVDVDHCPTCDYRCADHCRVDDQRCACAIELDLVDDARAVDVAAFIRGSVLGGLRDAWRLPDALRLWDRRRG